MAVPKEEIRPGAIVRPLDGGALLKIARVDDTHAHGANPDGRKPRKVKLSALLAKNRKGWVLEQAAEAEPHPFKAPFYQMTLDEYEEHLTKQVKAFFAHWRVERANDPDNWPEAMTGSHRGQPLLEWADQFQAWQEQMEETA